MNVVYGFKFLIASIRYFHTVCVHRRALWLAADALNVPMERVWAHDNSKFSWLEWRAYVRKFQMRIEDPAEWAAAWEHHWRHNDHHIEYWLDKNLRYDYGGPIANPCPERIGVWIPDVAVKEMIADWMAASYSYSGQWPKAPAWRWGNDNLVRVLRQMEQTGQPETTTRGFAVDRLQALGMITPEQAAAALAW